jgi:hypothetical protein
MRIFTQVCLLFCSCIVLTACQKKEDNSRDNSETTSRAVTTAADTLAAACQEAASQSKMIFMKSGHPKCGWCRAFDRYHELPEVRAILGKYFVVANIDTVNMSDGREIFGKYAQPGAPSWVIISPEKKVVIDSYIETGNVGYPLRPHETAHYLAAIGKAAPSISEDELADLSEQIQIAAEKK